MDVAALCTISPQRRLEELGTTAEGLSAAEAARRLRAHGRNEVTQATRRSRWRAFLAQFTHPLALLLWFGAGMAFTAAVPQLAIAIVVVVVINGTFAFFQEYRAQRVVDALLARAALDARVVRGGAQAKVPAAEIVPGDVLVLAGGDVVAADCVLIRADRLALDLSLLTGESAPVERSAEIAAAHIELGVSGLPCVAPGGAGVVSGTALAAVVSTGRASTIGKVAALLEQSDRGESLLEQQIANLSRLTVVIAVVCGVATLALATYAVGTHIIQALTFATGVIVALVPEGLLPLLTVSLAMGAHRMATRGALVRRLAAVEVVGSSTIICTDKTGTLTTGEVDVLGLIASPAQRDVATRARFVAALCNDARADGGDPIDRALLRWVARSGMSADVLRAEHPRTTDVPFDPNLRYMRVTCTFADGERDLVKGAPEALIEQLHVAVPPEIERAIDDAATRGERVLLLADAPAGETPQCLGLLRLYDPPRPEVREAVAACRRAGVGVVMLTGDHAATARGIAELIGLAQRDTTVIDGASANRLSDAELAQLLRKQPILARVTPEQKLRAVRVLRAAGDIVTVTGDGVNDAPALRIGDVGIAMGRRGTDVAKQASDVVLLDDNFATIVAAIEEGRAIKANIRRFIGYVLTSNVSELVPFVLFIFLPIPLPLAILQVLAIDLGTDLLPALALGLEPPSPRTLDVPPEHPHAPLLTRTLALRTFLFFGLVEAAIGIAAFLAVFWAAGWRPFESLAPYAAAQVEAPTLTFLGIVGGQLGCLVAHRDGRLRDRLSLGRNPWIALGVGFEIALATGLVYLPGVNRVFSMEAVAPAWLLVLPIGAFVLIAADQLRRWAGRSLTRQTGYSAPTSGAATRPFSIAPSSLWGSHR